PTARGAATSLFLLYLYSPRHPPPLHSFPTRRSSDLVPRLDREQVALAVRLEKRRPRAHRQSDGGRGQVLHLDHGADGPGSMVEIDRKSTRLNSSHSQISYAVFCLKKKKQPKADTHNA